MALTRLQMVYTSPPASYDVITPGRTKWIRQQTKMSGKCQAHLVLNACSMNLAVFAAIIVAAPANTVIWA